MKIGDKVKALITEGEVKEGYEYIIADTRLMPFDSKEEKSNGWKFKKNSQLYLMFYGLEDYYNSRDFELLQNAHEVFTPHHSLKINIPKEFITAEKQELEEALIELKDKFEQQEVKQLYDFNTALFEFCNDNKIDYPVGLIFNLLMKYNQTKDINKLYEVNNIMKSLIYLNEK